MANVASFLPIVLQLKETNEKYFSRAIHNLKSNSLNEIDRERLSSKKTKWQFVSISLVVFGIEICYAAETAFVSPILQKIGVPVQFMSMVWALSPLVGFFVCPILGILSDHCKWKMGRRRPFIIFYSIGIITGLFLVGYGTFLGQYLPFCLSHDPNICVIILVVIGVVLLDFNCDACQSPARAYLIDVSVADDHSVGLSIFTVMAGAGGALGYVLGGIPWDDLIKRPLDISINNTESTFISPSVVTHSSLAIVLAQEDENSVNNHLRILFTSVAIIYVLSTLICISSFKEIPLETQCGEYEVFDGEVTGSGISNVATLENMSMRHSKSLISLKGNHASTGAASQPTFNQQEPQAFHSLSLSVGGRTSNIGSLVKSHFMSILGMPVHLKWLCLTHCFSWMSLLCFSLYFTDFVGDEVYGGDPNDKPNIQRHAIYIRGVRMGSFCMALYSISCSFYSFFMRSLIERFTTKIVYSLSQLTYALGMLLFAISKSIFMAPITALTAGMIYSTLFTIPFILVANYHSKEEDKQILIENSDLEENEEQNAGDKASKQSKIKVEERRGLGADLALINSMVFCAQIILSCFIGTLMKFVGSKVVVIYASSLFATCGAITSRKLLYYD